MAAGITDITGQFNINEGLQPEDDRLPKRFHPTARLEASGLRAGRLRARGRSLEAGESCTGVLKDAWNPVRGRADVLKRLESL